MRAEISDEFGVVHVAVFHELDLEFLLFAGAAKEFRAALTSVSALSRNIAEKSDRIDTLPAKSRYAILAAETGHLVFSTLHTTGCQGTVNRIIDAFPHEQQDQIRVQLSTSLIAILSQALMPRKPSGMVAAYEFLVVTPAISNLIRENKTFRIDSAIQTGRKFGMQLLDDHL